MSGYSGQGPARGKRPEAGFRLLQKPFRKSELLSAVRETLDGLSGS